MVHKTLAFSGKKGVWTYPSFHCCFP